MDKYVVSIGMNGTQFYYADGYETTDASKATTFQRIGDAMKVAVTLNQDIECENKWKAIVKC